MPSLAQLIVLLLSVACILKNADSVCVNNVPCFPGPVDVSKIVNSQLNVNSTCGNPPETFCSSINCNLVCNASDPARKHPKEYMIDAYANPTYWKSKNLDAPVMIQLDLNQKLILHQVVVTFDLDHPSAVYLQRSQDFGKTYSIISYFAINCLTSFGVPQSSGYQLITAVCLPISTSDTSKQVSYLPRTDSAIQTQVKAPGPVRNYFRFTNLRYVLFDYRKPAEFNKATADPKKFFFTVKDFDVQGSCYCNGMSDTCNATNLQQCLCQKNTQGDNCQMCLPLHNNKTWQYGIACEACNCNGLASSCIYDASKGHGVCQNCTRNTTGDYCHECKPGFNRNSANQCVDCGCDVRGVNTTSRLCNETNGICLCKANVQGDRCDSCKDQFWGLSSSNVNGCNACSCRTQTTRGGSNSCNKTTGQCRCIVGLTGRTCNLCQAGYYSSQLINPTQCAECGCNPSGSVNTSCSSTGVCYCRSFYSGDKCQNVASGYFSASVGQFLFSSLNAVVSSSTAFYSSYFTSLNSRGVTFYHVGYSLGLDASTRASTNLMFTINLPSTTGYEFIIRYLSSYSFNNVSMSITRQSGSTPYSCTKDGQQETITTNSAVVFRSTLFSTNQSTSFGTTCLSAGRYAVTLVIPYDSSVANARILVTSLLVLPSYRYSSLYFTANSTIQSLVRFYYTQAYSLSSWSVYKAEGSSYMGYVFGAVSTSAIACQCNSIGSVNIGSCAQYGGQCPCKQNVTGRQCDSCLPNHANFSSGLGCSACGCHPFGSQNTSCNPQTGVCSCRPNVLGNKCDRCQVNHYGINTGRGCLPCNCSTFYSASQQCLDSGTCSCKQGIGGEKCSQCLPGYFNLASTGCTSCLCNPTGSLNSVCNPSNGSCTCKMNSMGASCNQCKSGFYGFSSKFSNACLKCQCSGKTSDCATATGFYQTVINTTLLTTENNVLLDGWTAVNEIGLSSGAMAWNWEPMYSFFRGIAKLTDTPSERELYFSAPAKYLGDKRAVYMLKMMFDLSQENTSSPASSLNGDVILKGHNTSFTLVTTLPSTPAKYPTFTSYEISFDERFWRKNRTNGAQATSEDMIAVLSNLRSLLVRGKWTTGSGRFSVLANIRMQYSTNTLVSANTSYNVENCSCPVGYTGLSCERCSVGYTRSPPYGSAYSACVPCKCNNHASTCDPVNGVCNNCQHSTTGNQCETCLSGYYGNATRGTTTDCQPCPCPGGLGATNQFSQTCTLASDGLPTCTACSVGYQGRRCEMCADGYSGNPMSSSGSCTRCLCSGNINVAATGNCNNITGECLKCISNTTGFNCQWCMTGTYGNALVRNDCKDCSCNLVGSLSSNCQNITGQCPCKSNVAGRICDRCDVNAYNFTSGDGCTLCNCNGLGSNTQQCFNNGSCSCKPRVMGEKCDRCMPGYYDHAKGCLPCNCSSNFTMLNTTCDAVTGRCVCKNSSNGGLYGGRQCDQCGSNAIGTPPNCALCHEPCYNNWQSYISQETITLANLMTNTSTLLAKFGSMSYSQISSQIQYLNGNLTYSATAFEGAQYDTRAKEAQFKQIEASIITFETSVNRSESQLTALEQYFTATSSFNGTVNLDGSTPFSFPSPFTSLQVTTFAVPTTASPSSISTMAQGYITSSNNNNVTGYLLYSSALQNYNQIQSANQSINQAATDIAAAMTTLSAAATERTRASNFLGTSYQTTFQANANELQAINVLVQSIKTLLNNTASTHAEATRLLSDAQATMTSAETTMNTRRTQANTASQAASEMLISGSSLQTNARTTQSSATLFKSNADALLYDAQQTATSVATSINKATNLRNQTQQVINTANQAINKTIPVSLARIQSLSSQITSTAIDETQINQTLIGAADGLRRAQEVQRLSQQAVNSSQATLKDIQAVESSLLQAEALRNSTRQIHATNDQKVKEVRNISATVENQFKNLQTTGIQTLVLVNTTINQINNSQMCFADTKRIVENATLIAQSAQNLSTNAIKTHQTNTQRISSSSTQINAAYTTTTTQHTEIQRTQANATQLLNDVTEAERLLAQFIEQNAELTKLQTESAALETELDTLITKFDQASKKFSSCNRN